MSSRSKYQPAAKRPRLAAAVDNLPNDIILIILLKLPVYSLLSFRNVCREWNKTITSSSFVKKHINQVALGPTTEAAATSLLIYSYSPSSSRRSTRFHASRVLTSSYSSAPAKPHIIKGLRVINRRKNQRFYLSTSCNGLLCVARVKRYSFAECLVSRTYMQVCNPATGKYRDIPGIPFEFGNICSKAVLFGFGYHPSIDDYKIIYSFRTNYFKWIVLVFSLKTNVWRSVDTSTSTDLSHLDVRDFCNRFTEATYSKDLYWIMNTTKRTHASMMVLRFNFDREIFELLPFPNQGMEYYSTNFFRNINTSKLRSTLASYNGSLYMSMPLISEHSRQLDIWILETGLADNKPIWKRLGIIPSYNGRMLQTIGFNRSGHAILKRIEPRRGNTYAIFLYAYIPKENKFALLSQTEYNSEVHLVEMETLVSP